MDNSFKYDNWDNIIQMFNKFFYKRLKMPQTQEDKELKFHNYKKMKIINYPRKKEVDDKRRKLTSFQINVLRSMNSKGITYKRLSKIADVSLETIRYWLNDNRRKRLIKKSKYKSRTYRNNNQEKVRKYDNTRNKERMKEPKIKKYYSQRITNWQLRKRILIKNTTQNKTRSND